MSIFKNLFSRKPDDVKDESQDNKELWFITIGPSGAGKTSLLACMHKSFENSTLRGFLFPNNKGKNNTYQILYDAYNQLAVMGNPNSALVLAPSTVPGTENLRQHKFSIRGTHQSVKIRFFDYPGAWMNPHAKDDIGRANYEMMLEFVQKSMVLIVAIDTPYLMEANGKYKQYANVGMIEDVLLHSMNPIDSLDPSDYQADKLILLVPVKCEKYLRTRADTDRLRETIKENFAATIGLTRTPTYASHLALAILPVQTTGNVEFSHFDIAQGTSRPVAQYMRNGDLQFGPREVEQPFRYAMSFLLGQYERNQNPFWRFFLNTLFSKGNLKEVSKIIQDGLHEDGDKGFEILHGRELISETLAKKKARALRSSNLS